MVIYIDVCCVLLNHDLPIMSKGRFTILIAKSIW